MFSIKEVNTGTSILGLPVGSKKNFRLYKKEQTCLGDRYLRSVVRNLVGDRKATAYRVVLTLIATCLWLDLEPTATAKKKDSEKEQDS